jgi:hypothetical protein
MVMTASKLPILHFWNCCNSTPAGRRQGDILATTKNNQPVVAQDNEFGEGIGRQTVERNRSIAPLVAHRLLDVAGERPGAAITTERLGRL